MLTFQQLIHRLSTFWEKKGCIIHQGHDLETGAGTFNPATFLRCLGPEPYRTAYVEPSRRPKDGRFGENPNRIQLFHQFQVILKPSPLDVQNLYIESLKALGLNLKNHDLRFVHDDWESPTLGAYGLGWEVWLDGMEISQFTYFQAVASLPLKPISAEITYGLERLAMYVQNVDSIFDVHWNESLTFRDIIHQNEVEWSAYNFTYASSDMWLKHFNDFEKEAKALISHHLPIPAYDFVIKASHAFNLLDARGVISVTERTGYITRIRDLARLVANEYLSMREKLFYPLLSKAAKKEQAIKLPKIPKSFDPKKHQDFLLEIGSEELPATFIPIGMNNLEKAIKTLLDAHQLTYKSIETYGSPRRLAVSVKGLVEGTADQVIERKGPALSVAFDPHRHLTPQGLGFLKSCGLSPISLDELEKKKSKGIEIRIIKEVPYLFATIKQNGKSIYEILSSQLSILIQNLEFPKKMRWADLDISYPRPIHWIVALYGKHVVPFVFGPIISDRNTFGHAQRASSKKALLKEPKDYLPTLKKLKVLAHPSERKAFILKQLAALEKKLKATAIEKERVLAQVLYLSEWPELTSASFDQKFLAAPSEILVLEMIEHQKYFPLADSKGKLKNQFIITADNRPSELIIKGNQKVLSARLTDGVFLYEQDLKVPLEVFNEKLRQMTFQKDLGSMMDKVMRLCHHAQVINDRLEIADQKKLTRATLLCKSDLASELVGEFPELQGTIGKYYALVQKEDPEAAKAIEEHWWPKSEHSALPQTPTGIVLSLADKIDNLLGYYSVGLKPTSSSDPYSLRRQTIGLIKIIVDNELTLNLKDILEACSPAFSQLQDTTLRQKIIEEILSFITNRAKGIFEEKGFPKEEVEASLSYVCIDLFDQICKLKAFHEFRKSSDRFAKLFEVYKRAKGQLEKMMAFSFNSSLAIEPAEKKLVAALEHLEKKWKTLIHGREYAQAFEEMAKLQPLLAHLFDTVKILAEDAKLKENRIALLQKVFSYFSDLLDFSKIQGV